jgi:hypothetical protein
MKCPGGLTDVGRSTAIPRDIGEGEVAWPSGRQIPPPPRGAIGRIALAPIATRTWLVDRAPWGNHRVTQEVPQ